MSHSTRRALALLAAIVLLPVIAVGPVAAGGTSVVVTTLADSAANDGKCSLREAIIATYSNTASGDAVGECPAGSASASDTITFAVAGTITESSPMNWIGDDLTIDGGGKITVSGAGQYLGVITGYLATVTIKNLTVTNGYANGGAGGGIINYSGTTMTLTNVAVTDSTADEGAGIYNGGTLTINGSTISWRRYSHQLPPA